MESEPKRWQATCRMNKPHLNEAATIKKLHGTCAAEIHHKREQHAQQRFQELKW
jgi:hypothetical protein